MGYLVGIERVAALFGNKITNLAACFNNKLTCASAENKSSATTNCRTSRAKRRASGCTRLAASNPRYPGNGHVGSLFGIGVDKAFGVGNGFHQRTAEKIQRLKTGGEVVAFLPRVADVLRLITDCLVILFQLFRFLERLVCCGQHFCESIALVVVHVVPIRCRIQGGYVGFCLVIAVCGQ